MSSSSNSSSSGGGSGGGNSNITFNSVNVSTAISNTLTSVLKSLSSSSLLASESASASASASTTMSMTLFLDTIDPYIEILHDIFERAAQLLIQQIPIIQQFILTAIDTIFIPKVIAKQILVLIVLETGMVTLNQLSALINYLFVSTFSSKYRLVRSLQYQQQNVVSTQDEWMDLAERIDTIQGNDIWRSDPTCPLYEQERIQARIDEYVHLMRRRDIFELMFLLRGSIGRNKFGLLHEGLFTKALAGSKVLTETYHNVVCAALDFVCDAPVIVPNEEPIPTDARLAFFNETRHAYGRTALLLSGGAALGFYHVGLVKALMENGLMPRVIGGSSAGSIVCAMIGTRTDSECLHDLFQVHGTNAHGHSGQIKLNFFRPLQKTSAIDTDTDTDTDNDIHTNNTTNHTIPSVGGFLQVYYNTAGAFHDAKRTIQGLMPLTVRHITSFLYDLLTGSTRPQDIFKNDTAHFRQCVRANVGDFTFQEAFDRTGRILNIVVTPNNASDPPRLLNYLTAPHVMVWSAAVASSSLPGVFEANRLVVKEADGWERYESSGSGAAQQVFSDGSMEQDLPMQQLSEMFNINHFIVSQANPHAVLFASYTQKMSVWANPITGLVYQILTFMRNQARSWLLNLVQCVGARRITPLFETQRGIGTQFFTQEYEGRPSDISLVPWLGHRSVFSALLHIIYNPSEAEFRQWIEAAERETWKYIPAIKSHIAEEVTLDRCVQRLRRRLLHESIAIEQNKILALQTGNHLHPAIHVNNNINNNINTDTLTTKISDNIMVSSSSTSSQHLGTNNNAVPASPGEIQHPPSSGVPPTFTGAGRVPSFFTSHSLVNLSGLSIGDQQQAVDLHESVIYDYAMPIQPILSPREQIATVVANNGIIPGPGWGGLGLRGNRSSGNLHRNLSDATGLFIDAPDNVTTTTTSQQPHTSTTVPESRTTTQDAGESTGGVAITTPTGTGLDSTTINNPVQQSWLGSTTFTASPPTMTTKTATEGGGGGDANNVVQPRHTSASSGPGYASNPNMISHDSDQSMNSAYIKTTSMARFYYRKSGPGDDYLQQTTVLQKSTTGTSLLRRQRTSSMSALASDNTTNSREDHSTGTNTLRTDIGTGNLNNNTNDSIGGVPVDSFGLIPSRPLASTRHNRKKSQSYSDFLSSSYLQQQRK